MKSLIFRGLYIIFLIAASVNARSQYLMDMIDTTKDLGKANFQTLDRMNHIRISGYMQPQYQHASAPGASSYAGGDFAPNSDNRFMLRRGRIRLDYARFDKQHRNNLQFVFQFDGTERGVFIRDFWGRIWENKFEMFAFTTGMFARPFGYEVNLSSSDRESPERGRMSQTLMKTERDLGFMTTMEMRRKGAKWKFFRIDAGIFNGQGLVTPTDYDSYKDFIGQIVIKPQSIGNHLKASGGVSIYEGGLIQNATYAYRLKELSGVVEFMKDSVTSRAGGKLPRQYYGANAQLIYNHGWGNTEIRGEYWQGTQTASSVTSETPGSLPLLPSGIYNPLYVRPFNGAFFYFLQHIVNRKHQIGVKVDWYDPNTKVKGTQIGAAGTNFTQADVRYTTLGAGYIYYMNENLKLVFWYDWVKNESTSLAGYTSDRPDNVLTIRAQFRF